MAHAENCLIHRLPRAERRLFLDRCEPIELVLFAELSVRGQPLGHAYFPQSGFISLVIDVNSHPALEVGMLGREGMLGAELILGDAPTPWRALVQGPGQGWRIEAGALRAASAASLALRTALQTFLLVRLH